MTASDIDEAIKNPRRHIRTKNDIFLILSSLNLLNAAIKLESYKDKLSYGSIKPVVSRLIQHCINNNKHNLIDEITYDSVKECAYLRCFNIQFSFHNINTNYIDQETINLISRKPALWDGIRLQPIAKKVHQLATECHGKNIMNNDTIMSKFHNIIANKI